MQVNNLKIKNFRNIESAEFDFDEKMNVISGENAQGKTNILESIWLFCGAKSFRSTKESSFIKFGAAAAKNEIEFLSGAIEHSAQMKFSESRTAVLDGKELKNPSLLAGSFRAAVFSPSDLSLVSDGPDKRRRFLDVSIGQLYPNYIEILRAYARAVMQRNKIIKEYKYDPSLAIMLDSFEIEIAEKGRKITEYRKRFLEKLNCFVPKIFEGLSGGREEIKALYVAKTEDILLLDSLKKSRREDSFSGVTSVGPHRDDIEFLINGISARAYGSQGQKRSVAIALKLAGLYVYNDISGEYPVCLLDDVMSELDETRQNYILNHVKDWQTFITCCDPSTVTRLSGGRVFEIKNGGVV